MEASLLSVTRTVYYCTIEHWPCCSARLGQLVPVSRPVFLAVMTDQCYGEFGEQPGVVRGWNERAQLSVT